MNILETNSNVESVRKQVKNIKKNQTEILELKNTITTKENLTGHNNVIEATEEGVKKSVELKIDQ